MARYGVTYVRVAETANQILQEGKQPTVDLVRKVIGTGSSTTIANHLRRWKIFYSNEALAESESLPHEIHSSIQQLWQKALTTARQIITSQTKQHIETLEKERDKYKLNNQRWQKLFDQWQLEKADLDNQIVHYKQERLALLEENKKLCHQQGLPEKEVE